MNITTFETKDNEQYTELYIWGNNTSFQLGLGNQHTEKLYLSPKIASFNLVIKQVACGENHSALITNEGSVYTCGSNQYGQLGIGMIHKEIKVANSPIQVEKLKQTKFSYISCGWNTTIAVSEQGKAFSWGKGDSGSLGLGSLDNEYSPQQIYLKEDIYAQIAKASSGSRHSALITKSGKVYTFGANELGQLGQNHKSKLEMNPKEIAYPNQKEKFIEASCGTTHTLFLTENGQVYASGNNKFGQLGNESKKNASKCVKVLGLEREFITKISCGHHSGALSDKGNLFIWGTGPFGEYLVPNNIFPSSSHLTNFEIGGLFGVASDKMGWGSNSNGELGIGNNEAKSKPFQIPDLSGIDLKQIACGTSHVLILGKDLQNNQLTQNSQFLTNSYMNMEQNPMNESTKPYKKRGNSVQFLATFNQSGNNQSQNFFSNSRNQEMIHSCSKSFLSQAIPIQTPHNNPEHNNNQSTQKIFDFSTQSPTIEVMMSENNYIRNNLEQEKNERRRLEKINLELRLKIKELQDGKGGLKEINENLSHSIDEINNLTERLTQTKMQKEELEYQQNQSQNEKLNLEQQLRKTHEEILNLKNKNTGLQDKYLLKSQDVEVLERELNRSQDVQKNLKNNYEEEIQTLKQQIYELKNHLEKEQAFKKTSESIKDNERRELVQLEYDRQNLQHQFDDIERKYKSSLLALENEVLQKQKMEDALNLTQDRIENLESENHSLNCELSELRKLIYEDLEFNKGSQSIQLDALMKINSQIQDENKQFKKRIQESSQSFYELKVKYNQLLQQLQQSEQNNLKLVQCLDSQDQMSQSLPQQQQSTQSVKQAADRQISDLLESANKHARNMTRIIKYSNLSPKIQTTQYKQDTQISPQFRIPSNQDLKTAKSQSPFQKEKITSRYFESDEKVRPYQDISPQSGKENFTYSNYPSRRGNEREGKDQQSSLKNFQANLKNFNSHKQKMQAQFDLQNRDYLQGAFYRKNLQNKFDY